MESEDGETWYDHVVEQMVPTHCWGRSFVSMAFSGANAPTTEMFHVIGKLPSAQQNAVFISKNKFEKPFDKPSKFSGNLSKSKENFLSFFF